MVYTYAELRERFSSLLEKAVTEGQIKFKNQDGQVFVIRPEQPLKKSPFDVRSIKLPITRRDIFEAIQESRARY
jgi:hypothetical protein